MALGARGGVHIFTTLNALVLCRALQTFRATRSTFTTLLAELRVEVTHGYARSLRYFYADAKIVGETVELACSQVKEAFAFRYAWFDLNLGWNVVNGANLPLGTCRGFKDGKYHNQITK